VVFFFSTLSKFYKVNSLRKFHKVNYVSILIRTPLTGDLSISKAMQRDTEKRVHTGIYIHIYRQSPTFVYNYFLKMRGKIETYRSRTTDLYAITGVSFSLLKST